MGESSTSGSPTKPLPPVSVHFLGTCSGGGPIVSRNCSSLAVDFGNDIWLFDTADGTLPRLHQSSLKISNISRIFITHMHADHTLGLVSILTTIMSGIGTTPDQLERLRKQGTSKKIDINIYGPSGLRELIRTTLRLTSVNLSGAYAVHELFEGDEGPSAGCGEDKLLTNEGMGMDLRADGDGVWRAVLEEGKGKGGKGWAVSAGPIEHRVPALGYILQEPTPRLPLDTASLIPLLKDNATALAALPEPILHPLSLLSHLTSLPPPLPYTLPSGETLHPPEPSGIPPRKLIILGDCSGGTKNPAFQTMCEDPSLLVHECTNGALPEGIQRGEKGRLVGVGGLSQSLVEKKEKQSGEVLGREKKDGIYEVDDGQNGDGAAKQEREAAEIEKVRKKANGRGHSIPQDVGLFARKIRARRLVINHFSAMFPSPRFPISQPYPSLTSLTSPYPFPVPHPITHARDPALAPTPLTPIELHTRIIMQSLASQVDVVWNENTTGVERRTIPARDYMVVRVPAHEFTTQEEEEVGAFGEETDRVMKEFEKEGGVWIGSGKGKEWVGVDKPKP